jgi:hypothetical protein
MVWIRLPQPLRRRKKWDYDGYDSTSAMNVLLRKQELSERGLPEWPVYVSATAISESYKLMCIADIEERKMQRDWMRCELNPNSTVC